VGGGGGGGGGVGGVGGGGGGGPIGGKIWKRIRRKTNHEFRPSRDGRSHLSVDKTRVGWGEKRANQVIKWGGGDRGRGLDEGGHGDFKGATYQGEKTKNIWREIERQLCLQMST